MKKIWKKIGISVMTLVLMLSMTGCGSSKKNSASGEKSKWDGETLVLCGWGGTVEEAMKKAWFEPFEEKYGVTIKTVSPPDSGQITAMGEAGKCDYDLIICDPDLVMRLADKGYMEKMDYDVIDSSSFDKDYYNDYLIAADIYTTSVAYNTDVFSEEEAPKSWADLWKDNVKKEGITLYNYPASVLEIALIADGVKDEDLYPIDYDRAFKKLDEIKSSVKKWYDGGEQSAQLVTSGEVGAGGLWAGRAVAAKENGDPVNVTFEDSTVAMDAFCIMKGCNNKDLAMEFLKFATQKEQGAAFMKEFPYGVPNNAAYDLISEDRRKELAVSPDKKDTQHIMDYEYWIKEIQKAQEKWNEWMMEK